MKLGPTKAREIAERSGWLKQTPAAFRKTVLDRAVLRGFTAGLDAPSAGRAQYVVDRTVLPIQAPKPPVYTELDARNATPPVPHDGTMLAHARCDAEWPQSPYEQYGRHH